jgi:hypothetical protein
MTFVLKTRAITGDLVPYRGEHIEYSTLFDAMQDAFLFHEVFGETIYVVDFARDVTVSQVPTPQTMEKA